MFLKILQYYLYTLAKITLWRHKPMIIGITGNVGKTSTREAVFTVLSKKFDIRRGEKNYNNEIGVPLTIIAAPHYGKNIVAWLWLIPRTIRILFSRYPKILILEMGADHPGDISYLVKLARPDIAIVTGIGEIPVHVEFFGTPEALSAEKANLVRAVSQNGHVVLNADDPRTLQMRRFTLVPVVSYGASETADIRIENIETRFSEHSGIKVPEGLSFKIVEKGTVIPIRLNGSLNTPQALASAAAFAVGKIVGMNSVEIAEALGHYVSPPGRMRIIHGISQSIILDDTYNAPPAAVISAIETLGKLEARRKIAVLGDMKELGKYSEEAHRNVGKLVGKVVDLLFTVGSGAKIIEEEVIALGFDRSRVIHADTSKELASKVKSYIQAGDIILVKGAQSMRMGRVVEAIMAEPDKAENLLVRQSFEWKAKP